MLYLFKKAVFATVKTGWKWGYDYEKKNKIGKSVQEKTFFFQR